MPYFLFKLNEKALFMTLLRNFFNWYFGRNALPYWSIVIFDTLTCFFGGLFIMWLRHPLTELLSEWPLLLHSFIAFGLFNVIGFRLFHTYSGILRYSQFIDLLRVCYANMFALALASIANAVVRGSAPDSFLATQFYPFTFRMLLIMYFGTALMMCLTRICIKLVYESALIGKTAQHTLVYGTHAGAIAITNNCRNTKPVRYIIDGYIGDSKPHYKERLMGKHIYSTQEDLAAVIRERNIKCLMVSPLKHDLFVKNRQLQDLFINAGVKIFISLDVEEWSQHPNEKKNIQMREVKIEDLLPRDEIQVDMEKVGALLSGKKVLITGSAGSIGSEMVRQIAIYKPAEMMLIDQAETPQHDIRLMMKNQYPDIKAETVVTSICKQDRMESIFSTFRPDYVFHAAAYKHVPMMEDNPSEISTDKAVNPTNVMGCSKRICEIYVQSLDKAIKDGKMQGVTQFVTTRFGNVLGSNGSVIPLFHKQLAAGGPLTVTHPKIIRFFMLIPEACKLVLEAGTHGKGGEIFVFDMGEPVRIADLARRMIQLSGATNVEIKYTGLREGEKLYEEVLNENENTKPSFHKKIRIAMVRNYEYEEAERDIEDLCQIAAQYDDMATVKKMKDIVPEYVSKHSRYEVLDKKEA